VTVALVSVLSLQSTETQSQQNHEQAAVASADAWLLLVDTGKYAESWDQAAELFKRAMDRDRWKETLEAARPPLGKVLSRRVKSKEYSRPMDSPETYAVPSSDRLEARALPFEAIPIVDLGPWFVGPDSAKRAVAGQVGAVCREVG
jgi:hypothetical protein